MLSLWVYLWMIALMFTCNPILLLQNDCRLLKYIQECIYFFLTSSDFFSIKLQIPLPLTFMAINYILHVTPAFIVLSIQV